MTYMRKTAFALALFAVLWATAANAHSRRQVASGTGDRNGAAVAVAEAGDGVTHETVFTLTDLSVTMTDAAAAGSHGAHRLYDFPAGFIGRLGCTYDLTTLAGAGGLADTAALVGALGVATVGTDNGTLVGAGEADFIASTAGTLTDGAGVLQSSGAGSFTLLDGHTTPIDLFLNLAVPDAGSTATDTLTVNGTITCVWLNVGDY
jgi:hypothetical protein